MSATAPTRPTRWAPVVAALLIAGLSACSSSPPRESPTPTMATQPATATSSTPSGSAGHPLAGLPANARLYVIGDSWSAGYAADPDRTAPILAAASMGWTVTMNAVDGTGYARTSNPSTLDYEQRAGHITSGLSEDVVLIQGSTNDEGVPAATLRAAVRATIAQVRARMPGARLVMLGPGLFTSSNLAAVTRLDETLTGVAAAEDVTYLSMVREQWITSANIAYIIDPSTFHPTVAGDAYLAGRLVADLQALR